MLIENEESWPCGKEDKIWVWCRRHPCAPTQTFNSPLAVSLSCPSWLGPQIELSTWTVSTSSLLFTPIHSHSVISQFSCSVVSDSLWSQLQHARLPCPGVPSPTPGVCSNSCPLSRWCYQPLFPGHPLVLLPSIFPSIRVFSNVHSSHPHCLEIWILSPPLLEENISFSSHFCFKQGRQLILPSQNETLPKRQLHCSLQFSVDG